MAKKKVKVSSKLKKVIEELLAINVKYERYLVGKRSILLEIDVLKRKEGLPDFAWEVAKDGTLGATYVHYKLDDDERKEIAGKNNQVYERLAG